MSHSDWKRAISNKKEAVFYVESVLLHHAVAVGTFNQYQGARNAHHTNVMEHANHFWRAGAEWEEVLSQLRYKSTADVPT